jgi:hypothetical protein
VSDRHLVYAAKFGSGRERGLAVGAVLLPGPNVDDAEARLDVDSLYALKPGAKINLVVNLAENSARVQKALEEKIRANGWIISSDAEATLTAEITSGQSQTVRYRMMRVGGPGYVEEATFTPQVPSLKVQLGEAVAWATGQTSRGAPPFVNLREGQSVQEEVDKWQKPRPEFFEGAKIPPRILHPKYREGLGTTLVNTRGLVPKGSEPAAAPAGGDAK